MNAPPTFGSTPQFVARLGDAGFWAPYVVEVLARHDLAGTAPEAGHNSTYPTFLCGDVVVKLFGYARSWRNSHAAERAAYAVVATDPEIAAPRLLGEGRLADNDDAPWPYLITSRVAGVAAWRADLSAAQWRALAAALGRQVRRLHAVSPAGAPRHDDWRGLNVAAAAARSSLPPHLVAQVDDYLAGLAPFDRVFVHGDLTANHVYVENGRLSGIIDWGDAMAADRHAELIQVHRDLFGCDKTLLRAFLDASEWPVGKGFARLALHRQAVGLAQHHTMDVFEPVAALFPLDDIATLDNLATELFGV